MKTRKNLLLLGAFLLSNFAFSQGTETRKVSPFTKLSVEGSFDAILEQGTEESVRIVSENIDPEKIITEQKEGALKIYIKKEDADGTLRNILKRGLNQIYKVKVYVTYKSLDKIARGGSGDLICNSDIDVSNLSNSGSGNINIKGKLKAPKTNISESGSGNIMLASLESDDVHLSVAGSGNIRAAGGNVKKQSVSIAGSGGINVSSVRSETAAVSIAGSGNANVSADNTLEGSITGSGSINYKGDANITKSAIAGSGRIRKVG